MAQRLVTGIYSSADPNALESALSAQNVDPANVRVIARNAGTDEHEDSVIDFEDVVIAMNSNSLSDDMTHGMGTMGDAGGTSVPGINDAGSRIHGLSPDMERTNYLVGLPIPDDRIDNYNDAIDEGRAVVTYPVEDANAAAAVAAFQAAGLKNVHAF